MQCFKRIVFFLFVCTPFWTVYGQQTKIDSLQNVLRNTINPSTKAALLYELAHNNYYFSAPDTSIVYYKKSIAVADNGVNDSILLLSYRGISSVFLSKIVHLDSVIIYANRGLEANKRTQDLLMEFSLVAKKANAYADDGQFDEAIRFHLQSASIADSIPSLVKKAWAFSGVGETYRLQGNGVKAVSFMEKAYAQSRSLDSSEQYTKDAMALNLSLAYDVNGDEDKAAQLLESAIAEVKESAHYTKALFGNNLGRLYIKQRRFEEAENLLLEVLGTDEWYSIPRRRLATLKELSTLYTDRGEKKNALHFAKQAYALGKEVNIQYHLEDVTRNLSEAYELNGNYEQSLFHYKEYKEIIEAQFDKEQQEQMLALDATYQKKEKEIQILELEKDKAIDSKRFMFFVSLISIVLMSLLLYIWFYSRRKRLEVEKHRLQADREQEQKELAELRLKNEMIFAEKQQTEKEMIALELVLKEKELTTNALSLLQKKEQFEFLIDRLESIKTHNGADRTTEINAIISEAKISVKSYNWEEFQNVFEKVHHGFYDTLLRQFPQITPNEKKLSAFLKLGLSTKDISSITNQSSHSITIARSRLRKKLGLKKEEKLTTFINTL